MVVLPLQIEVLPVIATVGFELTARAKVAVFPIHPNTVEPIKLYVVFMVGAIVMLLAFEAVLQVYVFAPPAVKLIEAPAHKAFVPVIATIGKVLTVTAKVAVFPIHPNAVEPVKLYVVFMVGAIVMLLALEALLQV